MKTGTTSVQAAARKRRDLLLTHGVRYPGRSINHRQALGALMGWSVNAWKRSGPLVPELLDVDTASAPERKEWDKLRAEIDADQERRIFISHEYVSQVDDATAQRMVDEIGEPIHICITLRPPGHILPSLWSQGIRDDALAEPMEDWLSHVFDTDPDSRMPDRFRRAYDQGQLVERWAQLVGPSNVTVIIVDKSDPGLLSSSFESMLGLPSGMLDRKIRNRSLTQPETELLRNVNAMIRDAGAEWPTFHNLVRMGAIRRGLEQRNLASDEARLLLPPWAAEMADKDGRRFADSIRRSQVRVIGDLETLATESPASESHLITQVPIDIAAHSVAGAISAAQQSRHGFRNRIISQSTKLEELRQKLTRTESPTLAQHARSIPPNQRAQQLTAAFTTRELAAALKRRLINKLKKSVPKRIYRSS